MISGKQNQLPSSQRIPNSRYGRPPLQPICPQQMPQTDGQHTAVLVHFPAYRNMPVFYPVVIPNDPPSPSSFTTGTTLTPQALPSPKKSASPANAGFPPTGKGVRETKDCSIDNTGALSSFETVVKGGHVVLFL